MEGFKCFQTIDISTLQMIKQYCQFRCHLRFLSIFDERLYTNWLHKSFGCHVFGINVSRGCIKKVHNPKIGHLKNPQFCSYQTDILATEPTHKLIFSIKFDKY